MDNKENLNDYLDQIIKNNKKAASWKLVALVGMCLSAGFMIAGIVLRIIMAIKGIG